MDIFSHILWTYVPFRNKLWRDEALLFAVLPDAGFLLILLYIFFFTPKNFSTGVGDMPDILLIIYFTLHSFITLGIVALAVWKLRPKLLPALSGWFIHILMDIPLHDGTFGTRFLYPLTDVYISGYTWLDYRVLAISYLALVLVYVYSLRRERKKHLSGKDWEPDWVDKFHLMADGLINRKGIPVTNAAKHDNKRTPDRLSGEDRTGIVQSKDYTAEPELPQDRG